MFTFLLVVHAIIAAALVSVILMQRSEGGGLGMGGSPSGLMSARGAADFLTRATAILAVLFVAMSLVLAALATVLHRPTSIDTSLAKTAPPPSTAPLTGRSALAPVTTPAPAGTPALAPAPLGAPKAPANGTVPVGR